MKKTEIFAFGLIILLYINKILGLAEIKIFVIINLIVFLTLSIFGHKLYKPKTYKNEKKATLFAVFCGLAFSFGIISFGAKVWNHTNIVTLVLSIPNLILFSFLLFKIKKSREIKSSERNQFYKNLLIRSSAIIFLVITVMLLPHYIINSYVNKEEPILHNRGLAKLYYHQSIELSSQEKFDNALIYAKKSLSSSDIAWGENNTNYQQPYEALYKSYIGLIKKEYQDGNEEKVLKYSKAVKKPIRIWYGDSTKQEASINTFVAKIHQDRGNYKLSDSLYVESLNILDSYYGTKNIFYTKVLNLLANSYRDQYYFKDAEALYKTSIYHLENDTVQYTNSANPSEAKYTIPNYKASTYAEMAWNYSLSQQRDKATECFDKAFKINSFKNHEDYSSALTRHAYNTLNNGDFYKAKILMEKALTVALEKHGELHYDYINTLDGLNSVNINLANYQEAEKGCIKAISLLEKITDVKDEYYASLIYSHGQIKYYQADYNYSAGLFNKALKYTKETSIQYADILGSLSILNGNLTKYSLALSQVEKASEIASVYFEDNNSPYLTEYLRNEAYINYLVERYNKADKLYTRCFSIDTLYKNQKKTTFASTLNGIALIKTKDKKFIVADSLFEKSIKIYKNRIGENHPSFATVLYNKAYLKLEQEDYVESERLFNQSLNIIKKVINDKHDKIADNLIGLGELKIKHKHFQEAINYFGKAITIYQDKFGEEHKKTLLTSDYIEYCKNRMK